MKTIIHYKNGQSYTINDRFICHTDWDGVEVVVVGQMLDEQVCNNGYAFNKGFQDTYHDVLYIEEVDKECGVVKLHFNPDIDMSVKVDVMTAKQRSKANRLTKQALLVREVNSIIEKHGVEVDIEHFHKVGKQ